MTALVVLVSLISIVNISHSSIQKQTTLSPQLLSQNSAYITINPLTTTLSTNDNLFRVKVNSQFDDYDIKLSCNDKWGFRPYMTSKISVTMNGYTPNPSQDTDLLFVFAFGD